MSTNNLKANLNVDGTVTATSLSVSGAWPAGTVIIGPTSGADAAPTRRKPATTDLSDTNFSLHPGYKSGKYYCAVTRNPSTAQGNCSAKTLYSQLFYFPAAITISRVCVVARFVNATGPLRFMAYANNGGAPDSLLSDFGTVSVTGSGTVNVEYSKTINYAFPAGAVWLAVASTGANSHNVGTVSNGFVMGGTFVGDSNSVASYVSSGGTGGYDPANAAPASFGSVTADNSNQCPLITLVV